MTKCLGTFGCLNSLGTSLGDDGDASRWVGSSTGSDVPATAAPQLARAARVSGTLNPQLRLPVRQPNTPEVAPAMTSWVPSSTTLIVVAGLAVAAALFWKD